MRLITFFEAVNQDTLSGGAGVLVFIPRTGRILVQIRGEHPDDKDSGKYDLFGGTLEEGETAEECARREAKEEGDLDFDELEEIGAFSSTENGDWDGEPYHVFLSVQEQEFPVKIDHDEVEKAGWVVPDVITDENATNRLVKVLQHEKLATALHETLIFAQHNTLTEATFDTDEDVDYIWDNYYKDFFDSIQRGEDPGEDEILVSIPSYRLPSKTAQEASNILPVNIQIRSEGPGNYYIPKDKGDDQGLIKISPNADVIRILRSYRWDVEAALNALSDPGQRENFKNEVSGLKLKTSIAHELSHWFDDAFHGQHITHRLSKAREQTPKDDNYSWKFSKKFVGPYGDEYLTPLEINAQVHQIRELKRRLEKAWDFIPFERILGYDASLNNTARRLKAQPELYTRWKRVLLQRMAREGILGKRMKGVTEAHLTEGKKDQYYQMFQSVVDPVKDSGSKDIGEEVTKRIDQVIRTLGREDRILWALRIFKKMYLMELRSIAQKYNDPEKWPWGPTQEKQLKKLAAIDVSQVPKFLSPNYEQIPSYKPRDESRDTELVQLGWSDPNQWDRGRRYTKQNNELRKRNTEIISQHYEDKPHLFNFHSYAGLEALLNEVGHYIGVGEAHTDVEPNNPVVTYQFGNQPYGQVKRELARLTKPLERKYKAGDVAQGEVFMELSPEWRWELLSRTCRKEAKALGHCGGVRDPNIGPNDRLLSLRELRKIEDTERTRSFAHLTFVIDTQTGELSQMRGQANTKPKAQYHPYIVPLLLDKRVTGFKPVAWKPEGNFHLSDLQPAQINQIIIAKPNLLNSLEPEGKRAVQMKIGKRAPRQPSPAAAAARQQPQQPQAPYPQMPQAMGEAVYPYAGYNFPGDWYHGMASSSRAFLRRKGSHPSNIGVWLTNNRNIAGQFAKQAARRMVDDQPILVVAKTMAENPLVFDTYREYLEMWREYGDSEKMRRSLMRKGHDSILIAKSDTDFGGEPRMDLAVFQPSMVKAVEKETLKTPVREGLDLFGDEEDEDEVETIAGWITEGGKILEGNLHEHVDLAYAELEERGYRPEEIMNKTGDDLMGIAWGLGWIRWVLESGVSLYANWFKTTPYAIRTLSTFVGSSYFDKGVTFEINRKPFEFPDAQKASGFLRKQATSITEQDSILDAVLAEPGQNPGIGDEKEKKITPEISMLVSPYGSYRFIYRKGGKIVSGLQVVSRDGKHATTANVKTHPDFLRQGLARELLGVARKKFKRVDHSEHLTGPGEKFAQGTG